MASRFIQARKAESGSELVQPTMSSLLDQRRSIARPKDYSTRVRQTMQLLRYARISAFGDISFAQADQVEPDVQPRADNDNREQPPLPLRPSFAAIQLYLMNETEYGVTYVKQPLKITQGSAINVAESLPLARSAIDNIVRASEIAGDIARNDSPAALVAVSEFERRFPSVYNVFRFIVLLDLSALLPAPALNSAQTDRMYRLLVREDGQERLLIRLERDLLVLRDDLLRGDLLTRQARDAAALAVTDELVEKVLPVWKTLRGPRPVKLEQQR